MLPGSELIHVLLLSEAQLFRVTLRIVDRNLTVELQDPSSSEYQAFVSQLLQEVQAPAVRPFPQVPGPRDSPTPRPPWLSHPSPTMASALRGPLAPR